MPSGEATSGQFTAMTSWMSQARHTSVSGREVSTLVSGWLHAVTPPNGATAPADVDEGAWSEHVGTTANGDDLDHWFRRQITLDATSTRTTLVFEGLATIAEVWCDGHLVGSSTSMFQPLVIDVSAVAARGDAQPGDHTLVVVCRSLTAYLAHLKVPRARWKTRLVAEQRLRGVRTTLMGRIPSWTPDVTVVGMWRPVSLVEERGTLVDDVSVAMQSGSLSVEVSVGQSHRSAVSGGSARLGDLTVALAPGVDGAWVATFDTSTLARWMPHTHGPPIRHQLSLTLTTLTTLTTGTIVDVGLVGVRSLRVDSGPDGRGFGIVINEIPVFCRGGSLMPLDLTNLHDDIHKMRTLLTLLVRTGINMVRVSGTAVPMAPEVLDLCDELGLMVWHDLPFANFDYPATESFIEEARRETRAMLDQYKRSPSLVVVCGGSEIEQQAAMMGLGREVVADNPLLDALQEAVAKYAHVAWVRSSPTGGHLPFAVDTGVAHYFGIGAYRQPLADARHSGVRFASECLAFANVPSSRLLAELLSDGRSAPTDPAWKAGVPRDRGVGWDFDDVRDHYARLLFSVDPNQVAWTDPGHYLALGRATSYEVLARTFAEWRRSPSLCDGGLVWFLNDVVAGAGWGAIDVTGDPKAALHGMARVLQPVALAPIDEGVNGLDWWIFNDGSEAIEAVLELTAWRPGGAVGESATSLVSVPGRSSVAVRHDEVFGRFTDPTYTYRFGEPLAEPYSGRLIATDGSVLAEASFVPQGRTIERHADLGLRITSERTNQGSVRLTLTADRVCRAVNIEVSEGIVWPNMVDVFPHDPRVVVVEGCGVDSITGSAEPLNTQQPTYFSVASP